MWCLFKNGLSKKSEIENTINNFQSNNLIIRSCDGCYKSCAECHNNMCRKCGLIEPSRENINGLEEYENKLIEKVNN